MRILWVSNSGVPTAYGQQTALFIPRIRAAGHEVAIAATVGCDGAPRRADDGTLVLPRVADPFGNDVVLGHFDHVGADVLVSLVDPHVLSPEIYSQVPWCAWAPIDCSPLSPLAARSLRAARWIWSPSRFGVEQVKAARLSASYMPHGVDSTTTYYPRERVGARRALARELDVDLDKKFLVVMVAANRENPSRKGFQEAFSAFVAFRAKHPDAVLYLHTEMTGVCGGIDLVDLVARVLGDGLADAVLYPPQYRMACGMLGTDFLANVYSSADVYLSASHGEGFGLPVLEAALCGCPGIVVKNTAQPEVCRVGWLVDGTVYQPHAGIPICRVRPDVGGLVAALELAYEARGDEALRVRTRESAFEFDVDTVFEKYMKPALEAIEHEIGGGIQ